MRIRPWVITGAAWCCAAAAGAVLVLTVTPQEASAGLIALAWGVGFILLWSGAATLLLLARQSILQAIWAPLPLAVVVVGGVLARHAFGVGWRLLGGVLLATLFISAYVLWRLRRGFEHEESA
ncbi:MAG: hypothetical protein IT406_02020 [Candidatus Yanofskybacteria bacterium]|nr:hypothetical protein [Candidatus Yanofskybacteria bacterium]